MAKGETYEEFVEKFKPKKTTDDCYTPPAVYEAVAGWACSEYGIDRAQIVRPFWPGADYQKYDYKEGDVVLDNPPFSIITQICRWYEAHGVRYFLFAPTLTNFSINVEDCCHVTVGADITYENGATINTSFVTNLDAVNRIITAPDLGQILRDLNNSLKVNLPKYDYPDCVITSARAHYYSRWGVDFRVPRTDAHHIGKLDAQKEKKKTIFGSGFLLSEKAAAEKAAAEKAAAEKAAAEKAAAEKAAAEKQNKTIWKLSEREREIIRNLGTAENR